MASAGNVLITGCSTGIGKATALHLGGLGYRVFAAVRKKSDMEALSAEASCQLTPILLDVTDPESICRAGGEVREAVGGEGLMGLVNNAGVAFHSSLEFAPMETLRQLFDVNVFGLLAVTQAFLPLIRQARGRIVNISSQAALVAVPFNGPYTASKVAINALSDALRLELKPIGVQVSTFIVGSIDTPIWERSHEMSSGVLRRQPPEANELYGVRLEKYRAFMAAVGRRGIDPQAVARLIAQALTAKRAKHYCWVSVDLNVRLYCLLRDILPDPLKDWLILRAIGLG